MATYEQLIDLLENSKINLENAIIEIQQALHDVINMDTALGVSPNDKKVREDIDQYLKETHKNLSEKLHKLVDMDEWSEKDDGDDLIVDDKADLPLKGDEYDLLF